MLMIEKEEIQKVACLTINLQEAKAKVRRQ